MPGASLRKPSVLIVDDNLALLKAVTRHLTGRGCEVSQASSVNDALQILDKQTFDVLLVDYGLPDGTGADIVASALPRKRARYAYCITGVAISKNVVSAMRAGCRDVIEKPFDLDRLDPIIAVCGHEPEDIEVFRTRFASDIVGHSPDLMHALAMARDVADSPSTVLITGESGTGKELFARAIHAASQRKGAFVALNCAALPESLVEAELFGHTKGAFSGAVSARAGHVLAASKGTLFLDEIGDMPLSAQARLLRVLQEREITPLGADAPIKVDVRVVAATHKDLDLLVDEGKFRRDLYYRLSVIPIHLPALRDRPDDIPELSRSFLARSARPDQPAITLAPDAEEVLLAHSWPGNVRELAHVMERVSLLVRGAQVSGQDLGRHVKRPERPAATSPTPPSAHAPAPPPGAPARGDSMNLRAAIDSVERELIMRALEKTSGNRTEAAALLGLNRTTLVEKLRKIEE